MNMEHVALECGGGLDIGIGIAAQKGTLVVHFETLPMCANVRS